MKCIELLFNINPRLESSVFRFVFSDGTVLDNIGINGNTLVSDEDITELYFDGKLDSVTVYEHGENVGTYENVQLVSIRKINGRSCFILKSKSESDIFKDMISAKMDYLAMMCEVELE